MEYYRNEKWASNGDFVPSPVASLMRSVSQKSSTSKSPLLRSFSLKGSSHKSQLSRTSSQKSSSSAKSPLSRCSSQRSCSSKSNLSRSSSTKSISSKSCLSRSPSQKCSDFAKRCSSLAKEQRARFYIMKRCVTMLVCWNNHGDS